jgi:hypothetical protein
MNQFSPDSEYPAWAIANIYENRGDIQNFVFITGAIDTGDKPLLSNVSANFRKTSKKPKLDTQGPDETDT